MLWSDTQTRVVQTKAVAEKQRVCTANTTLNWKIWEHHYAERSDFAELYDSLWNECCAYAEENLGEDELRYFYNVTD